MMLRNFLYRVAQYARENRGRMIKALAIAAFALFIVGTIYNIVERWQAARYEKRAHALGKQITDAEAKAKDAEDRAAAMQVAIEAKYAELRNLETRAVTAERNLRQTRAVILPLKETYEETRNSVADIPVDTSCDDACAELARIGYACK